MDIFSLEDEEFNDIFLTQSSSAEKVENIGNVAEGQKSMTPLLPFGVQYDDVSDDDFQELPSSQKAANWDTSYKG